MGIFEWFWSPKGSPANCNSPIPEGWTDDMRVPLPVGKTVPQLVDQILTAFEQDRDDTAIHDESRDRRRRQRARSDQRSDRVG